MSSGATQPPRGSRDYGTEGVARDSAGKKDRKAPQQRHLASEAYHGVRHLAGLASAGKSNVDTLATMLSSPELPGANCGDFGISGGEATGRQRGPDLLPIAVVRLVSDGHQIQELGSNAEVGTLCVAVACQSSKQASRAVLETTKDGILATTARSRIDTGARVSALSAGASAMQALLRRPVEACSLLRGGGGGQQPPEESLVLYCKLPGGAIMASPLEGPAFRLRRRDSIVEGTNALEPGNDEQQKCWTLPTEGFEALQDLEISVAPGLPTLARDMAKDANILGIKGVDVTRPVAEDISLRLRGDGHRYPKRYVVVPHTAGIVFASLDPGAACATKRRGTGSCACSCPVPARVVMARLEPAKSSGTRGTTVLQQQFVLENLDVFRDGGDERGDQFSTTERGKAGARSRKKLNRTRRTARRVSMPVTYAALLEEATFPSPATGPSFSSRILNRWRRGHAYRAGGNQVVPGIGEHLDFKNERRHTRSKPEGTRFENADGIGSVPIAKMPSSYPQIDEPMHRPPKTSVLIVSGVESASSDQAVAWASTPAIIWALLAAACRPDGASSSSSSSSSSTPGETQAGGAEKPSSCAEARRTACTLLERVFGDGVKEEACGEETAAIDVAKASVAIDQWYEGFRSVTASFGREGGGGESQQGQTPALLLHETPRLLLEGMLKTPAVRSGFVERGLARHLAEIVRTASAEANKTPKKCFDHRHEAHPRGGDTRAPGLTEPLTHEADVSVRCPRTTEGKIENQKRDAGDSHVPPSANLRGLPWWLLFSHGLENEGDGPKHGQKRMNAHEDGDDNEHENGQEGASVTGGSADGRSTSDIDGRSCMTTLDEMSAAGGEAKGLGSETSREFDPMPTGGQAGGYNDGHDDATGDNSLASAGTAPTSDTADQREYREGGGAARRSNAGETGSFTRERVSPPLLRLDALDSILDTKEWTSPQHGSSHAAVILSAASTRAAPEHLPTFLSARGSTSRASARHGSGRSVSVPTGRTTQRDTTTPRELPVSEGVGHTADPEPGVPHPRRSPSTTGNGQVVAVDRDHGAAANRGSIDLGNGRSGECDCRRTGTGMSHGDVGDTAVDSLRKGIGGCSLRLMDCPTDVVLSLARNAAGGRALSGSRPRRYEKHLGDAGAALFEAKVSVARLLVSLLPSTPIEHNPEDSLVAALDVLSLAGALSWIDKGARSESCCGGSELGPAESHPNMIIGARRQPSFTIWASELERVGIALLARAGKVHLDLRISSLQSQCQRGCRYAENDTGMASGAHKIRVREACLMGVECVWLTRLLLRRVVPASTLDGDWRSELSPEATASAVRFCGRALEMWSRSLHSLSSRSYPRVGATSDSVRPGENSQGLSQDASDVSLENAGYGAEFLLLTAPMVIDLAELLVVIMGKATAWGENLDWARQTLSLATACPDGNGAVVAASVDILTCLVRSVPTEDADSRQATGIQGGQQQRRPYVSRTLRESAGRLEKGLHGQEAVFQQTLTAVVDSITAILYRARTVLETSYDTPPNTPHTSTPDLEPVEKGRLEARNAVYRVWVETAPIFRQKGPILAILKARHPPTSDGEAEGHSPPTIVRQASAGSSAISAPCLAATLRLSSAFFALCLQAADGEDDAWRGLRHFVAPLFSGFRRRWDGMAGRIKPELNGATGGQPRGEQHRVDHDYKRDSKADEEECALRPEGGWDVLLCRLHLEALVQLASIPDPDVQMQLRECGVAPFLLQHLLAADGGGAGAADEELKLPRSVHGSVVHSSSCGALISHESQPSHTIRHPLSRNGSGGTGSTVQHGTQRRPERNGSGEIYFQGASQVNGTISAAVAGGTRSFSAGDRVDGLVSVRSGRPRWFPGRVESVHEEDGTVHVCYDDGDEEARKDPAKLRPRRTRTVDRRPDSRVQARSRGEAATTTAVTAAAPIPTVLSRSQDGKELAATPERPTAGRRESRSSAADSAHRRADIVGVGPDRKWVPTGDRLPSSKISTSGADSDSGRGAGSVPRSGKRQPQSRLSTAADVKMAATSEGYKLSSGAVVDAAGDGDTTAEDDRKDDDAYFEIPTVFDAASTADNTERAFPADDPVGRTSVVPRIDLQSPVFRTRVFSSQLGPGSSLSTPTTGGTRVLDTLRTARASRSEASLATARLPSGRSSRASRRPSLTGRPSASGGGGGPSSRGLPRGGASLLSDCHPPTADGGGLEREIARLLDREPHASSKEKRDEEIASPTTGVPRSARRPSGCARGADDGDDCDAAVAAPGAGCALQQLEHDGTPDGVNGGPCREGDLRMMQGCAVALLLGMAASLVTHDSPLTSAAARGEEETTSIKGSMAALERVFDSDRGAHIIPTLKARWSSGAVSPAETPTAVMAKLVCAALFDAGSYSLDGDHIAAGRFGSVIVSKCPLPLGGTRTSLASGQAPCDPRPSTRAREEHARPAEEPLEGSLPRDQRHRRSRQGNVDVSDEVALKVVERDDFDGGTGLTVVGEVLALRALAGVPGVCRLYDFGVTRLSYVLVIERCACSLKDWRLARGVDNGDGDKAVVADGDGASPEAPSSDEEVALYLSVFRQVVSAVAAMAERGVIHFDLKCDNILVRNTGRPHGDLSSPAASARLRNFLAAGEHIVPSVCVADFGEAVIGRRKRSWQWESHAGTDPPAMGCETPATGRVRYDGFVFDVRGARGTERIQSPEMILLASASGDAGRGRAHAGSNARGHGGETVGRITSASDVWSLGCLLYELLSDKLLFGDLEWSEFFVVLTAGEAAASRAGDSMGKAAPATAIPVIPSPQSLLPFTGLGSAETIRQLLETMLVRSPAHRPGASQMVRHVNEALEVIVPSSVIGRDEVPRTKNESCSGERPLSRSTPRGASARSTLRGENAELPDNVAHIPRREQAALSDPSRRQSQGKTPNEARKTITNDNTATDSALLRPCSAVGAHRDRAVKRLALEKCGGIINRLGSGAFLLTLDGSTQGSHRVETDGAAAAAWHRLGPETTVCCDTAGSGEIYCSMANGLPSFTTETGRSPCSLGNALSALGISHVVCVMPQRREAEDTEYCLPATERNPFHPSHCVTSRESRGSQLLKVHVAIGDDEQEENSRGEPRSSVSSSVKGVVRDVLEFATGQRIIFVGVNCEGDMAGAVAVAWAMDRSGKGAYETMLQFRQEHTGFWVDLATLNSVIG